MTRLRTSLVVLLLLRTATVAAQSQPDATERAQMLSTGRVGAAVVERLSEDATVPVLVVFAVPPQKARASVASRADAIRSTRSRLMAGLPKGHFTVRRNYDAVEAVALDLSWDALLKLSADPAVVRIDLDEGGQGGLGQALPLIDAVSLQALGFLGSGIRVAVIDSGIETDHPALNGRVAAERCFCSGGGGCCPGGGSDESGTGSGEDDHGHGTNVAGIVAASGGGVGPGVAPEVELVSVKVLDSENVFCCSSDIVAALDWIVNEQPDVDVVNMSLGTFALYSGDCDTVNATNIAFASLIDTLRTRGTLTVVSSMNNGSGTQMGAPACISGALAVGAVWDANVGSQFSNGCFDATTAADQVTCFSNSNAQTDLFAPGGPMTSAGLGGGTSTYYGTSQAAPMVTGCIAALLGENSTLAAAEVETALENSSTLVVDTTNGLSFPRLDCAGTAQELGLLRGGEGVPSLTPRSRGLLLLVLVSCAIAGHRWGTGTSRKPRV